MFNYQKYSSFRGGQDIVLTGIYLNNNLKYIYCNFDQNINNFFL